jgi:hypothetical protein
VDLERDLLKSDYIVNKAQTKKSYAQNIYAALCNMRWCKISGESAEDTLSILKEDLWSCSWRHSGGIVARIREEGIYLDWYCSGIGTSEIEYGLGSDTSSSRDNADYVAEGVVTEEIANDFKQLGWVPIPWKD